MKKKKTFFDEDISIDEKLFDNFKIDNIASWSHLELWCTIQNVEAGYDFFKGVLCGTAVVKKLFDIVLDAIQNTDFIDKHLDNLETIEIIEKLYADNYISRTFKAKEFWIDIAFSQDYSGAYAEYWNTGTIVDDSRKYKLLNAIFKKNPYSIVKFYDKHKLALHQQDSKFERWLLHSSKNLASRLSEFAKVYKALCNEAEKLNNISMHLN